MAAIIQKCCSISEIIKKGDTRNKRFLEQQDVKSITQRDGRPGTALWTASLRPRRMEKELVKVSSELAQDHRALGASVRDVVNSISDAGSTRSG